LAVLIDPTESLRSQDPPAFRGAPRLRAGYRLVDTERSDLSRSCAEAPHGIQCNGCGRTSPAGNVHPESNVYDYETYDRIADNPDIDVIYVVLPNAMHAEYTIRAAEAGKHVICEKPMATSTDDCRSMIEACERNDRRLSIGYRLHFEPHHQRVMKFGQEEVYGPVTLIQNGFGFHIPDSATDQSHVE
jgi:predicted dehydrogenase